MKDEIAEAAGLLRRASDMLLTVDSPSTSVLSERIVRTVLSNERLRSQIPRGGTKGKPKRAVQRKGIKEKPFEFALLNSKEDDTEDDFFKKEMVAEMACLHSVNKTARRRSKKRSHQP